MDFVIVMPAMPDAPLVNVVFQLAKHLQPRGVPFFPLGAGLTAAFPFCFLSEGAAARRRLLEARVTGSSSSS